MKRKIEDYIGKKVAIYANTKEEWKALCDLHKNGASIKNHGWSSYCSEQCCLFPQSKSNFQYSPKNYFDSNGFETLPASDFLEDSPSYFEVFN